VAAGTTLRPPTIASSHMAPVGIRTPTTGQCSAPPKVPSMETTGSADEVHVFANRSGRPAGPAGPALHTFPTRPPFT